VRQIAARSGFNQAHDWWESVNLRRPQPNGWENLERMVNLIINE